MSRALVTGGAGFIGSHVAEGLLRSGYDVCIVDDCSTGVAENIPEIERATGKTVQFVRSEIGSRETFTTILEFKPDLIFHLAAQANVRKSVEDPAFDATTNVLGTINLLEAGRRAGVKGFIFSSTGGAIYGEQETFPADELHRTTPECPYGVSKRAGELYVEYYARIFDFSAVVLRYANVFGPRQNPEGEAGVVAVFTERLLAGKGLVVNGDGEQTRDFVYVGDVVKANLLTGKAILDGKLRLDRNYTVFNVGTGVETSVNDVVRALRSVWTETSGPTDSKVFEVVNGPAKLGEQRRSVVDTAKIKKELGWNADVGFQEGMLATIRSFRSKRP